MLRGYHHVTLRVSDLDRSRAFYSALPGFVLDQDFPDLEKLRYRIGDSRARLVLCAPLPGPRRSLEELESVLCAIGAPTDGVTLDRAGALSLITFRDPDNVQWEFFEEE
jgi:catechol 2,3-dioxygenase-like lactoylglutathione lyase family enzyme